MFERRFVTPVDEPSNEGLVGVVLDPIETQIARPSRPFDRTLSLHRNGHQFDHQPPSANLLIHVHA
jgi:hypothetical protein